MSNAIAVVGAGGWGTALAKILADKSEHVTLWCHGADSFRELVDKRENSTYLPGVFLPSNIEVTQVLDQAVENKSLVICAVPSHAVRQVFSQIAAKLPPQTIVL